MLNSNKKLMGNTVGRFSKANQLRFNRSQQKLAYIAGFLDGDGSIMLQLHRQESGKEIFRIKTVICFYQDQKYRNDIEWIQKVLGCGYVYNRNDRICELRIEGFKRTLEVLLKLYPFIRLKRKQAKLLINLIPKLQQKVLSKKDVAVWIQKMRGYNYFSSQRKS